MIYRRLGNVLMKEKYRLLLISNRHITNAKKKTIEGIRFGFEEEQARVYFDQWLKSLW